MSTWAILLAGGNGIRMGANTNKTLLPLGSECVLCHSLRVLRRHCEGIVLVSRPQDQAQLHEALSASALSVEYIAAGGFDRQESVRNGLSALPEDCDIVLVHDGARPLLDDQTVINVLSAVHSHGAGVASTTVTDTIKIVNADGTAAATPPRDTLRAVQTPQGFRRALWEQAHREASSRYTDDAALVSALGVPVQLVEGNPRNIKITTPEDLKLAAYYLSGASRIGHGYDAHRLVENRALILGGIAVPYEKGLLGHSDADVLLHAIMDALLGAAALGDIGQHFPDRDPQYKGVSSLLLLQKTAAILQKAGYGVGSIDATIIAQRPKLMPFLPAMRQNIAKALDVPLDSVSVKATTTEGMGFEGAGEGISAHAVALIGKIL